MKIINKNCPIGTLMKVLKDKKGNKNAFFFYNHLQKKTCRSGDIINAEFPYDVLEVCTLKCIKQGKVFKNDTAKYYIGIGVLR